MTGPGPSAPTSAPSAPTSTPTSAPSGVTGVPPTSNAPAAPSGMQQEGAPLESPKARFPWKTKARVGEAEHELELDLAEYKHRVKVDGEELEVPFEDLGKSYERVRASMKRFDEASKLKREVEQREQAMAAKVERLEQTLKNPQSAARLLKRALGEQGFYDMVAQELAQRIEYEKMPPDQRAAYDQRSQQEQTLSRREQELQRREQELKRIEDQRVGRLAEERQKQLVAEWVPALEAAGLPAKTANGQVNPRMIRMLADTLSQARAHKVPMTLREAVAIVRDEYNDLVGHHQRQQQAQTVAALEAQPGRVDPPPPATPPAPRMQQRKFTSADFQRELDKTWRR